MDWVASVLTHACVEDTRVLKEMGTIRMYYSIGMGDEK